MKKNLLGTELTESIHYIRCPFSRLGYFTSVCAIFAKTVTLIDSDTATSSEEVIFPHLRHLQREQYEISRIIHTHALFDHCGGAPVIKKKPICSEGCG